MSTLNKLQIITLVLISACDVKQPITSPGTDPVSEVIKDKETQPEPSSQATNDSNTAPTTSQTPRLDIEGYQYLSSHLYIYRHASNDPDLYSLNRTNDQLCLHNEFNGQTSDFCWLIRTSPGSATWGNFQASGPLSWTHTLNTFDGDTNISVTINGLWQIQ